MREIKFRAWDGKEMHENVVIVDGKAYKRSRFGMIYAEGSKAGTPMQYTGLKDKNGKEIYEGDIVKYPHIVGFDDIWKVEFSNGSFVIRETIVKISLRELAHKNNLEVIGNIYENPELLEESK